jgi:hypothetical protein
MSEDRVYVLPMAVLKMLNYRDPSAEKVASYDDYMVYKREDALKLPKLQSTFSCNSWVNMECKSTL